MHAKGKFGLKDLKKVWVNYSEDTGTTEGRGMNLQQFRKFMTNEFQVKPGMMPVVNQVFERFDADDSGFISLEELFNGLAQVRLGGRNVIARHNKLTRRAQVMDGSNEDKSNFYFDLYDIDGGGSIEADEVRHWSRVNLEMRI